MNSIKQSGLPYSPPEEILVQARLTFGTPGSAGLGTCELFMEIWAIRFLAEQQVIREPQRGIYHPAQT